VFCLQQHSCSSNGTRFLLYPDGDRSVFWKRRGWRCFISPSILSPVGRWLHHRRPFHAFRSHGRRRDRPTSDDFRTTHGGTTVIHLSKFHVKKLNQDEQNPILESSQLSPLSYAPIPPESGAFGLLSARLHPVIPQLTPRRPAYRVGRSSGDGQELATAIMRIEKQVWLRVVE
jgi:hypothetical protein